MNIIWMLMYNTIQKFESNIQGKEACFTYLFLKQLQQRVSIKELLNPPNANFQKKQQIQTAP